MLPVLELSPEEKEPPILPPYEKVPPLVEMSEVIEMPKQSWDSDEKPEKKNYLGL